MYSSIFFAIEFDFEHVGCFFIKHDKNCILDSETKGIIKDNRRPPLHWEITTISDIYAFTLAFFLGFAALPIPSQTLLPWYFN